jgi:hypothetical protein
MSLGTLCTIMRIIAFCIAMPILFGCIPITSLTVFGLIFLVGGGEILQRIDVEK